MKAAVLYEVSAPLVIEEVALGDPRAGEVEVRLVASGVCHSDLHSMNGTHPWPLPAIFGHEGAGVVERVGTGVTNVKQGDHVILTWLPYCGECRQCLRGRPNICERMAWYDTGTMMDGSVRLEGASGPINHYTTSAFAERTVVPAQTCVPVDKDLDLVDLCLFGCAVTTGIGAVLNTADVQPGDTVAVIGCGGVGLNVVQGARIAGAGRIVAIDRMASKLELAQQLGATETIDASIDDPTEVLPDGVDWVFEAIGRLDTIELAISLTGRGGEAILIGMAPMDASVAVNPLLLTMTERAVRGSWYGGLVPDRDFPILIDLYRKGELHLDSIVQRIPLEGINEAFEGIKRGDAVRSVIVF